jgi:hypothetical protein
MQGSGLVQKIANTEKELAAALELAQRSARETLDNAKAEAQRLTAQSLAATEAWEAEERRKLAEEVAAIQATAKAEAAQEAAKIREGAAGNVNAATQKALKELLP